MTQEVPPNIDWKALLASSLNLTNSVDSQTVQPSLQLHQAIQEMAEHECVFNQHVRFIGDRVAAVVAVSEEIARAAVRLRCCFL